MPKNMENTRCVEYSHINKLDKAWRRRVATERAANCAALLNAIVAADRALCESAR